MITVDNFLSWLNEALDVEEEFIFGVDYFENGKEIMEQLIVEYPCKTYKIVVKDVKIEECIESMEE